MNREIKFRAWDRHRKCMQWPLSDEGQWFDGVVSARSSHRSSDGWYDMPLMQHTGLKDKNGVEIYEGDIIEAFDLRYVVEWCQNLDNYDYNALTPLVGFAFRPLQEEQSHKDFKSVYFGERFEVIGNIYENPELLENKNEPN